MKSAQAMVDEMRAALPGIIVRVRCGRRAHGWAAQCHAGFADGAFPMWNGTGASRDEAIADAVDGAWSYWVKAHGSVQLPWQ